MERQHIRLRAVTSIAIVLTLPVDWGCDPNRGVKRAEETPSRQFILTGVSLEERRDGQILWTGTAERADGETSSSDVSGVILKRLPQEPAGATYTVRAPTGVLELGDGKATFHDARITDEAGATLLAGVAHYDEDSKTILADGPMRFMARGLDAHAKSGVLHLDTGVVDVKGPVHGRFLRNATMPRPPRSHRKP